MGLHNSAHGRVIRLSLVDFLYASAEIVTATVIVILVGPLPTTTKTTATSVCVLICAFVFQSL